jgi:hypothetical protein
MSLLSRLLSLMLPATIALGVCHGATLVEDFPSTSYSNGQLDGQGSATGGWGGAWGTGAAGTTSRVIINTASNLTYAGGGYSITQTGTGLVQGNYGDGTGTNSSFRGSNRTFSAGMSGTIWFSILVSNTDSTAHTGVSFNSDITGISDTPTTDYDATPFRVDLFNTTAQLYFGSTTSPVATGSGTYAVGSTHLLVGSLTVGAGNDSVSVWIDPSDLGNLGAADLSSSGAADLGGNLSRFGVFDYGLSDVLGTGGNHGKVDALRISDGGGSSSAAFTAVTGFTTVPEPGRMTLLSLGVAFLGMRRRRDQS